MYRYTRKNWNRLSRFFLEKNSRNKLKKYLGYIDHLKIWQGTDSIIFLGFFYHKFTYTVFSEI